MVGNYPRLLLIIQFINISDFAFYVQVLDGATLTKWDLIS